AEGQLEESRDWLSGQAIASFSPRSGEPGQPPPPQDVVDAHVLASLGKDALVQRLATMEPPLGLQAEGDRPAPTFDGGRTLVSDEFTVRSKSGQGTCRVVVSFVRAEFYERQGRPWRIERWTLRDDAGDST
ncbi:MAG TPA: hypothetical protein PJ982_16615, partial [Lacipirellulaceae bacterium]|nr:hypothetical protein [Lacipirellulaceae bacterium]